MLNVICFLMQILIFITEMTAVNFYGSLSVYITPRLIMDFSLPGFQNFVLWLPFVKTNHNLRQIDEIIIKKNMQKMIKKSRKRRWGGGTSHYTLYTQLMLDINLIYFAVAKNSFKLDWNHLTTSLIQVTSIFFKKETY